MTGKQATMELENLRGRVFFAAFEKFGKWRNHNSAPRPGPYPYPYPFNPVLSRSEQPLMNLLAASKRGAVMNADPFDTIIG